MYFQLLGPLTVSSDDRPIVIPGVRQRKILVALLLSANRVVSISRLIDALWSQSPPKTARAQIQNCVGQLRRSLKGDGAEPDLARSTGGFVLNVDRHHVDSLRFEDLVHSARRAAHARADAEAARLIEQALGLWRGDVAEGMEFSELQGELQRWRDMRLSAIHLLLDVAQRLDGGIELLLSDLRRWAAEHKYDDVINSALAEALHRSGRSAEASLLLEAHRVALDSDLDCAVGPRSRNVEVAIAAHSRSRILGTATSAEVAYRLQAAMRALEEIAQIVGAPALSRSLPIGQDLPAPASMGLR
jgi:DNA-binding SARP family transcriptional activator